MAITHPSPGCGGEGDGGRDGCGSALLPAAPFWAPRYQFGMLLGVDDFESEQAYHRGKTRLHNAWLHGAAVVWGLRVCAPGRPGAPGTPLGELRVEPGVALDGAGRELQLAGPACVGVPAWVEAHRGDEGMDQALVEDPDSGDLLFSGHVAACFRACLARPVPALAEPCAGAGTGDVVYSRAQETVDLRLVPGDPPPPRRPWHRVRLLFGLAEPRHDAGGEIEAADQEVLDALHGTHPDWPDGILERRPHERPRAYLRALRHFAALDGMELAPAAADDDAEPTPFPVADDACVLLARVWLRLRRQNGALALLDARVDNTVRSTHLPTATIQELLCGPTPHGGHHGEDAGGPRIHRRSVRMRRERVWMRATRELARASVTPEAFSVSVYELRDGWHPVKVRRARLDHGGTGILLHLSTPVEGSLVRLIARGTGPAPLLGHDLIPLAGAAGGPPGRVHDGRDFVYMARRSEP